METVKKHIVIYWDNSFNKDPDFFDFNIQIFNSSERANNYKECNANGTIKFFGEIINIECDNDISNDYIQYLISFIKYKFKELLPKFEEFKKILTYEN